MLEKSSSQSTCSWRKIRCFQMRLQHFISERQVREEYRALRLTEIKDRHLLGSSNRFYDIFVLLIFSMVYYTKITKRKGGKNDEDNALCCRS